MGGKIDGVTHHVLRIINELFEFVTDYKRKSAWPKMYTNKNKQYKMALNVNIHEKIMS